MNPKSDEIRSSILTKVRDKLSDERIDHIVSITELKGKDSEVLALAKEVFKIVVTALNPGSIRRRGRKLVNLNRDLKISLLHEQKLSLGQIAKKLNMTRQSVQAALRRFRIREEKALAELKSLDR
jgi:predicted HTH domain antitoxin